ncbi:ATP-binding cassette sub-family A member 7-like [Athalia rosae]|uniref:ATP-binding cassette sub-family A member 7-like n=1 Tax=Athalia rosae TaxID=37344 RepID=UPI002033811D|nr:ATP-binding cassette sub-family A member 7-like [Athalia rosae]
MKNEWRVLLLLLQKDYKVRKRHWLATIIEFAAPALIISLFVGLRTLVDLLGTEPIEINTTYPLIAKEFSPDNDGINIMYTPQNEFTNQLMKNATYCFQRSTEDLRGFDDKSALLEYFRNATENYIWGLAVNFDSAIAGSVPNDLVYTLRSSYQISNNLLESNDGTPGNRASRLTNQIPLTTFQMCLDDAFIKKVVPNSTFQDTVTRYIQNMPYPPYQTVDVAELSFRNLVAGFAGCIFIVTLFMMPSYIAAERDTGVNALLKMNAVRAYQNFLSWVISGILFGAVIVALVTIALKVPFSKAQPAFWQYSNGVIIWISILLNFIHCYTFCMHLASYFSKAWAAQGVSVIIVFVLPQILALVQNNNGVKIVPYLGVLFPIAATLRLFSEFNDFETLGTGAQWKNLFTTQHPILGLGGTIGFIMILSVIGIFLHFLAAMYLDAVLPGKYGARRPPLFFLECFCMNKVSNSSVGAMSDGQAKILEPVPEGVLIPGIQVRNLEKTFTTGCFNQVVVEAVRGMSFDFYKGQITALLGHNGAGKTTTISILTGLTSPSSGTVIVDGKNLKTELQSIRNDLGMCPQENLVFPELTVAEQLRLFGLLKKNDRSNPEILEEVDDLLVKLKISDKRNALPRNLSGGQKRRLCLGMALIGNASTLFLDEPTSGMDPETSRVTWDIILNYRTRKTIIITTHSMEEADVLGDRIAIMNSGRMKCYGTSMFLKKYYGKDQQQVTLSVEPWCEQSKIQEVVGDQGNVDATVQGRVLITLPMSDSLPQILDTLEGRKAELGITGVSVSTITLEQVFLKAAEEEDEQDQNDNITEESVEVTNTNNKYKKTTGLEYMKQAIHGLLSKKLSHMKHSWGITTGILIAPMIGLILMPAFNIDLSTSSLTRPLDLSLYPNSEALIYSEYNSMGNTYKRIVEGQGGKGTPVKTDVSVTEALLQRAVEDIDYYREQIIVAAEFNSTPDSLIANGLYGGAATLSAPLTVNLMSNALLKTFAGDGYSISTRIGSLPQRTESTFYVDESSIRVETVASVMLYLSIFFVVAGLFVVHPLLENSTSVKRLQQMTGLSPVLYWGVMFVFDYGVFVLSTIGMILGLIISDRIFGEDKYGIVEIGVVVLLLLLFGMNAILSAYVVSFINKPLYVGLLILCLLNIILAQVQVVVAMVMSFLGDDDWAKFLIERRVFSIIPHISFTFGFSKFVEVASNNARCRGLPNTFHLTSCVIKDVCCELQCWDGKCEKQFAYFRNFNDDDGIEEYVLYLALMPIVLVAFLCILHLRLFPKLLFLCRSRIYKPEPMSHGLSIDSEVANEKSVIRKAINQQVKNSKHVDENVFLAYELSKRYPKWPAVREVNFRVKKNECFGLLGVNGAGKSTTFRMLVGEEIADTGILIRGKHDIKRERTKYLAGIGYCPQINALITSFNAYEHLSLFARLRGVPADRVAAEVQMWIDKLGLNKFANKPSGSYSGGNKRRLNIAMALIGNPELVLLDEPTAGVDPAARRSLWGVLQSCQASGQAFILTSHSMEECEALCNRLLIMVRGEVVCVGASQQLKGLFGAGFDITILISPERSEEDSAAIKSKIEAAFACELRDEHAGYLFYHVTDPQVTWTKMFGTMNSLKAQHSCVQDFSVSSSTLEQLFIQLARYAPAVMTYSAPAAPAGSNLVSHV